MADQIDIKTAGIKLGGVIQEVQHEVTVKPVETPIDKQARIRREDRQFWASHFWTLVVVAGLAGVLVACFFNINHANAEIAQWARSSVLTLVSAGIAFVAGRISAAR